MEEPRAPELTFHLDEVLTSLQDQTKAQGLRATYLAAARGITRLGAMDLVQYQDSSADSSADLSLWEMMAPMMGDTVQDVNAVVAAIRQHFAQPQGAVPPIAPVTPEAKKLQRVEQALRLGADDLMRGVTSLGERMRSPAVVSDRWNLMEEIQTFRGRFREQLGNLVYETAELLAPLTREQVVPGLQEDVQTAIVVRATMADLKRVLAARAQKVREAATAEDVQWNAQQLEKELDSFGQTPAYRSLPVSDKRQVVERRAELRSLSKSAHPDQSVLTTLVEAMSGLVEDASTRPHPLLEEHDRTTWAKVGVGLEQAGVVSDFAQARLLLGDILGHAEKLYGRSSSLDAFLRKQRKVSPGTLTPEGLTPLLEELREILAGLALT